MPGVPGQAGGRALYAKYGSAYMAEIGRRGAAARKANIRKNIIAAMTEILGKIVEEAKSNASWSTKIPEAISFGGIKEEGGIFRGQIIIDLDKAPEARAFEYGSGIHATKGPAGVYPIRAKNVPNLVFWWEKAGKWFVGPALPIGHPGVAPKPYIHPAIEANMDEMKARLKSAFKRAYIEVGVTRIEV